MTSCERLVQAKKQLEKEVIKQNGLQSEDDKILDQSQFQKNDNVFEPDFVRTDYDFTNGDEFKSDSDISIRSNLSLDSMSEDAEEDCLIEIRPLLEPEDGKRNEFIDKELLDLLRPESHNVVLREEDVEDLLSDVNEMSGEDNLIEIDISMGSIRQSGCGIGT